MNVKYLILVMALAATAAGAETRYVSDQLIITLRTGPSTQHAIIESLPTGAAVELLETDEEEGYSRVRSAKGNEGWVITRYLMKEPSARSQLAAAKRAVEEANRKVAEANQAKEAVEREKVALAKELDRLKAELKTTTEELTRIRRTSSKAMEIDQERQQLKKYVRKLERDLQALRTENEALSDRSARDWFMVGAGVLLLGIFTGAILARMRKRRRGGWESF
ncbi:MAG: TIGR04211 family SH3 domain-containing protein [Gammaproteobacteria bacterium]